MSGDVRLILPRRRGGAALLLALLLLLAGASGHITTVCTATAPSTCADGRLWLLLGTYSSWSANQAVTGSVTITPASGAAQSFSLTSKCESKASNWQTSDGSCASTCFGSPCDAWTSIYACEQLEQIDTAAAARTPATETF